MTMRPPPGSNGETPRDRRNRLVKEIRTGLRNSHKIEDTVDSRLRELVKYIQQAQHYFMNVEAAVKKNDDIPLDALTNLKMEVAQYHKRVKELSKMLDQDIRLMDYFCHDCRQGLALAWQDMMEGKD